MANLTTTEKKPYFGFSDKPVKIKELVKTANHDVEATVTIGGKRYVFRGQLCVDHITGSWKWGEQVAINVWTVDTPQVQDRAKNDGYNRVAIALDPKLLERLCEKLLQKLWGLNG